MAGRNITAGLGAGRGGAGRGSGGRGKSYAVNKISTKKVGLCKDLEGNIFGYGTKTAANLMRTTQEKLIQYVGTKFGGDIAKAPKQDDGGNTTSNIQHCSYGKAHCT